MPAPGLANPRLMSVLAIPVLAQAMPLSTPLPLRLLTPRKYPQNPHHLLQPRQPLFQLRTHLRLIATQLSIKVLTVRRSAHGGAEDGLDDERVVRLERVAVSVAEGVGELFGRICEVVAKALGCEV